MEGYNEEEDLWTTNIAYTPLNQCQGVVQSGPLYDTKNIVAPQLTLLGHPSVDPPESTTEHVKN